MNTEAHAPLLLADDDPDDRFLIMRACRRVRPTLDVQCLGDGVELLECLEARASRALPRLVLMDLNMPRMDGREVLARLQGDARFQGVPCVVLTTSERREDHLRVRALGAADVLTKPNRFQALVDLLEALAQRHLDD